MHFSINSVRLKLKLNEHVHGNVCWRVDEYVNDDKKCVWRHSIVDIPHDDDHCKDHKKQQTLNEDAFFISC